MNVLVKGNILKGSVHRLLRGCRVAYQSTVPVEKCDVASEAAAKYTVGHTVHGYTVEKVEEVSEYSLTAVLLRHDATGASHLHVARNDNNNVFGVAFRTTPLDDTGVPHILEHTVLCGSARYPVRDPFFKMLNRSMATFMNAFTSMDWTMYPFSTQNPQDYENLMSVYLDAAFFPQLKETDFRQEGWRLEHEDVNDANSPITFKGIVFNEMKGVFSNSQHWFHQRHGNLLLPDHTYGTVYGGDPAHIPDLSWTQLRDFHASHYHPSNTRFYTYGDFPLERHLYLVSENVLSKFSRIEPNTQVPPAKRWTQPRSERIHCAPDPMAPDPNKQSTLTVSFLMADITDLEESATLSILGALLVGSESAPFYRALIEAGLGADFSPVLGYDANAREASFGVGLQGIAEEDAGKVEGIIERTIDEVIEKGFEQEQIEAVLHRVELSQKHQSTSFGLNLGVSILPTWTHDGDPIGAMNSAKMVALFKQRLAENPRFLQEKVQKYLKDNPHRLTLVMTPDPEFESQRQQEEEKKLKSMLDSLSEDERKDVFVKGRDLAALQDAEEDVSCLPSIRVQDIRRTTHTVLTQSITAAGHIPIQLCEQPTNGVTYFRAVSNMAAVPEDLKPYVNLFCSVLTKMGTQSMDYREQSQRIDLTTGGLGADPHITHHPDLLHTFEQGVLISSYCLDRNIGAMFDLWTDIFTRLSLADSDRLTTLIRMSAADLANGVSDSGHAYAMGHAASSLNPAAALKETMGGLSQVALMKKVAEGENVAEVTGKLQQIADILLSASNIRCALNTLPETTENATRTLESFLQNLPHHSQQPAHIYTEAPDYEASQLDTQMVMPFQVNFVSRSVRTVPYTHPHFASLRILARLMSAKYLHKEIREKGGAYGGGAAAGTSGLFNFYSYRDPNSLDTVRAFDAAVQWARDGRFSDTAIDEAKLSTFQQVDLPIAPGQQGMGLFLHGLTEQHRQAHRDHLFSASRDSIVDVANRYLSAERRVSSVSLLGPSNPAVTGDPTATRWLVKEM